jgi:site-specific DNA-methyltransferase (adenine-specific)
MLYIKDITNTIIQGDCLEVMKQMPDNCVDLVLTDPPYGQVWGNLHEITSGRTDKLKKHFDEAREWDIKPSKQCFDEIARIGKQSIIWGYNNFTSILGDSNDLIVWDKDITGNKFFLRFEIAWCSFNTSGILRAKKFKDEPKIHPTQKPVELFSQLLGKYTKERDVIFDPFIGSGTTAVACERMGRNYIGVEISEEYCLKARKRVQEAKDSMGLFKGE